VAILQLRQPPPQRLPHPLRPPDEVEALVLLDGGQADGAAEGVVRVGLAVAEQVVAFEEVGYGLPHDGGAQRHVGTRQPLRHRHDVRHHAPVVDAEPLAGPPEARHHLVGDEQHALIVADPPQPRHVLLGGYEDAVGADDGLDEDGGDVPRALHLDDLPDVLDAPDVAAGVLQAEGAAVAVAVGGVDHARHLRDVVPAGVAGQRYGARGGAVVRPVAGYELRGPRVEPRDLDGGLVRLGPPEGEVGLAEVARRDLRQLLGQPDGRLRGEPGGDVEELLSLFSHRPPHTFVSEAEVRADELGREVQVAFPVAVGEVGAVCLDDELGPPRSLEPPGPEYVPTHILQVGLVQASCLLDQRFMVCLWADKA